MFKIKIYNTTETEKGTEKWKGILCSWISRINTVKIIILPNATYRFTEIPIKTPISFVEWIKRNKKTILKFIKSPLRPWIAKTIQNKKNNAGVTISVLKIYKRFIEKKPVWYWQKNRHVSPWDKTDNPNLSTYNFSH